MDWKYMVDRSEYLSYGGEKAKRSLIIAREKNQKQAWLALEMHRPWWPALSIKKNKKSKIFQY